MITAFICALVAVTPDIPFAGAAALFMLDTRATAAQLDELQAQRTICETAHADDVERCRVRALIELSYAVDPRAQRAALHLYDFDGAYRGQLHLVPRLPVGRCADTS